MINVDPKSLKGTKVVDVTSGEIFVVVGGKKDQAGQWFLRDADDNLHLFQDCEGLNDVKEAIALCRSTSDYADIIRDYGHAIAAAGWTDLGEESPALMAAISIALYAENWTDFVVISQGFGVGQEQSTELNQEFRRQLQFLGLNQKVKKWYEHEHEKSTQSV